MSDRLNVIVALVGFAFATSVVRGRPFNLKIKRFRSPVVVGSVHETDPLLPYEPHTPALLPARPDCCQKRSTVTGVVIFDRGVVN
jgi:hypothetical protein